MSNPRVCHGSIGRLLGFSARPSSSSRELCRHCSTTCDAGGFYESARLSSRVSGRDRRAYGVSAGRHDWLLCSAVCLPLSRPRGACDRLPHGRRAKRLGSLEYSLRCAPLSLATIPWHPWRAPADLAGAAWYCNRESSEFPHPRHCCAGFSDCSPRRTARLLLRLEIPGRLPQSSSRHRMKLGGLTCPRGQCLICASQHLFVVASSCQTHLECIHAAPPTRSRINSSGSNKGGSMWTKQQSQTEPPVVSPAAGPASSVTPFSVPSSSRSSSSTARNSARLGSSLQIKGHITGTEDLQIDGKVEGSITLRGHQLTVGSAAQLNSEIPAAEVVVYGKVVGNVHARDRVDVKTDGSVVGDISTARISIEDGAHFKGRIEIDPTKSQAAAD